MHRFGLIGFGSIAENGHLPALQSFPDIAVTAVADVSPERRARAVELLPQARVFESPRELIVHANVTCVDICTPPGTHADLVVAACERGLHGVVCEKPFVLTEEDYYRVREARGAAGARVISVNNWLYSDLYGHVLAVLRAGEIGAVRSVFLQTGRPAVARGNAAWEPDWRTAPMHAGGGIILDHGWHQVYLLLGWMGEPIQGVWATARTADARHAPVEDEARIELQFPSAVGCIELSWTSQGRTNSGFIEGTAGRIEIQDDRIVVDGLAGRRELVFAGRLTTSSYHPDWFEAMLRVAFLPDDPAEANRNFEEAGVLVSVVCAAYDSASHGGARRVPHSNVP